MSAMMLAVQKAAYDALAAALAPTKLYDVVPAGAAFPYVSGPDDSATDASAALVDMKGFTLTYHAWTRARGRKACRELLATIEDALHEQPLAVAGGTLVELRFDFSTALDDPDGQTQHGVIRFRGLVTRSSS